MFSQRTDTPISFEQLDQRKLEGMQGQCDANAEPNESKGTAYPEMH
jgi:hypothetical protein